MAPADKQQPLVLCARAAIWYFLWGLGSDFFLASTVLKWHASGFLFYFLHWPWWVLSGLTPYLRTHMALSRPTFQMQNSAVVFCFLKPSTRQL